MYSNENTAALYSGTVDLKFRLIRISRMDLLFCNVIFQCHIRLYVSYFIFVSYYRYSYYKKEKMSEEDLTASTATFAQSRTHCQNGWFSWLRWKPTGPDLLLKAEEKMLSFVKSTFERKFVNIGDGNKLLTLIFNKGAEDKTPLVMVHGFAGAVGLWARNLDALSESRTLYCFDLLGFGRSSHPCFEKDSLDAENQFMESIELWRKEMNIGKMILLGHSFGGYLASSYALKYPDRVKHLILADPWGFPEWKRDPDRPIPIWIRALAKLLSPFNPLAVVRAAGPIGPSLLKRARADLGAKFVEDDTKDTTDTSPVFDYIYHCNAQYPSGEAGFKSLTSRIGFAANPMIKRIGGMKPGLPVSFVYGARTWMDIDCGHETQTILTGNPVEVYSIKGAGHHVYADQPELFHNIINSICESADDMVD